MAKSKIIVLNVSKGLGTVLKVIKHVLVLGGGVVVFGKILSSIDDWVDD